MYILLVRINSRACICTGTGASSKFFAIMTFAIDRLSPSPSTLAALDVPKFGALLKYPSDRACSGVSGGVFSTDTIAFAKSSSVVCSEQSITAVDSP